MSPIAETLKADPSAQAPFPGADASQLDQLKRAFAQVGYELRQQIVGQEPVLEALFVGVPGLAKTLLISTLAQALSLQSKRIQFTPDLMPSDITGSDVLDEDPSSGKRSFRFVPGPVFTHILLADEINRTPPKTQAALLQSMAEGRVSAGGQTYELEAPFLVFATQNPIEQEGTYPLPEAQLDRFLFRVDVPYPSAADEVEVVRRTTLPNRPEVRHVLNREEVLAFQALAARVPVAPHVIEEAVAIVRATRPEDPTSPTELREWVAFGAGPRAGQALIAAAKARAALHGRFAAEVDDVRALASLVLRHRIVRSFRAEAAGVDVPELIARVLATRGKA